MAENKKSVILYTDLIYTFEQLTDTQAGRLIKHLFRYVNDQNPEAPDKITAIAFEPIKQQLKRDLKKWEKYIEKQKENGKKGGRPKQAIEQEDKGLCSVTDKIVPNHSEHGHFAYLLYDKVADEYKFGETGNLIKRWYAIKRPKSNLIVYDFVMLPAFDCQQIERELINKYQGVRISGDWFKLNEEMVESVLTFFSQKSQAYSGYPKKADSGNVNVIATVNDLPLSFGEVFYDAEELINKNQIEFERICMAGKMNAGAGKNALRKFHLHLESAAKYPQTKKQLFAGFEKWVMNEKNFSPENKINGTAANRAANADKPGVSEARTSAIKEWGSQQFD